MDFFAMSIPGASGGTNDPWYFSWTVDSSQSLDDTAGSFFGNAASNRVNYLIGIEINCDGAPRLEMWQNGQPWEREFAWNVDYFIAMFANGPNSMEAQLWRNDGGNNRSLITGSISVTSRVVGFRRQMEFILPSSTAIPLELRNNSTLCLYLLSVKDVDGTGTVLDGVGQINHNISCEAAAFDLASKGAVFINTTANCKQSGRPTDPGINARQCLSYANRDQSSSVAGEDCTGPFGISIDGVIDPVYTLMSESSFASPYAGGSTNTSDFVGESSARTYTYVTPGATSTVILAGGQHADLANLYTYADTNYLYLIVTGPTSLGWENEPDRFNLYLAIDMPGQTSGNDSGLFGDAAPGAATAPASRLVNFKGWDPDYVVELVWRGMNLGVDTPANLYAATGPGSWTISGTFLYQNIANSAVGSINLYYNRTFPQYEFAVPWSRLGLSGPPSSSDVIRLGAYTTGDENIEAANQGAWDIADQSPGIGQGCSGEGCHERVGDEALDDDALNASGIGDHTPFVGRTYGNPNFVPATDNSLNDVDTIEEYFALRLSIADCQPAVDIEKATNSQDADSAPGPVIGVGSNVTWTYVVRNTGSIALTNIAVYDDKLGTITNLISGDINGNRVLETNEIWTYSRIGSASAGQYMNMGYVTGLAVNASINVTDSDPSHYFGSNPGINIEKATNGQDADNAPGPTLGMGSSVTWTYAVTNAGNVSLTNVVVTDDKIGVISGPASGDLNANNLLDVGETWIYSATGIVVAGQYVNTGTVNAVSLIGQPVTDKDPSHYFGGLGGIDIEKATNGQNADTPTGPVLAVGSIVTWTYVVRNTGNVGITNISVYDDKIGSITNLLSGDANNNRVLETNETWTFSRTGTAVSGQYMNSGSVTGTTINTGATLSDIDPSHYFGSAPGFTLAKTLIDPTLRPAIPGESIRFRIDITNTGNVSLVTVPVEDRYQTNYLAYVNATPGSQNNVDDGVINWSNVGPLPVGANTSIVVNFIARHPTTHTRTNVVVASPLPPVGHPPIPPMTNRANYNIDAPAQLGDYVWHDLNADGLQQGGEPGLTGVVVTLYNLSSNALNVVTSGVSGAYAFTNLVPGSYFVGFSTPAGGIPSPVNQGGDDTIDSDASTITGYTMPVILAAGGSNNTLDAGFYFPGSIGDFVWSDVDYDGIQDGGEVGIPGVTVVLYDLLTNVVGITTTAINGAYAFTNLMPGGYFVGFIQPTNFNYSPAHTGIDDAIDSDADPVSGQTPAIILVSGQNNNTLDAGFYQPASVGDFVWREFNPDGIQNPGEPGYNNLVLELYSTNDVLVGTTTSTLFGAYAFTNLPPGDYYIKAVIPLGVIVTPQYQGGDPTLDNNLSPLTGMTEIFTLTAGEFNRTIDVGIYEPLFLAQIRTVSGVVVDDACLLTWETGSEYGTAGWFVERETGTGEWSRVSDYLPSHGHMVNGSRYEWPDANAKPGQSYRYRLVEVEAKSTVRISDAYDVSFSNSKKRAVNATSSRTYSVVENKVVSRINRSITTMDSSESSGGAPVHSVKAVIRESGIYFVSSSNIAEVLGVPDSEVLAGDIRVENLGRPVAALRRNGGVVFYAEALETIYSDENVYFISLDRGRVASEAGTYPAGHQGQMSFTNRIVFEKQVALRPDIFENANEDVWLWQLLISGVHTQFVTTFDLPAVANQSGGQLHLNFKGASQDKNNGFHGVTIELNGVALGSNRFYGTDSSECVIEVPPGRWLEQGNRLRVVTDPPPGVTRDSIYIDKFTVVYQRKYTVVSNELAFTAHTGPVVVNGFNSSTVEVWEVTDRWSATRLMNFGISGSGNHHSINFHSEHGGRYYSATWYKHPSALVPVYENDLKINTHKVDYLVIYGKGLKAGADSLAADRSMKGLAVKIVSIQEIYDAFNYGICDGRVLKTFLGYTYRQWIKSPRYVVLVGDGSIDYRNFSGAGDCLIPTPPQGSPYGVFSSDHHLGDVNGDGQLDMAVGRIPVTSLPQLENYVTKLKGFEEGGSWRQNVLVATDNRDAGGVYIQDGDTMAGLMTNRVVMRADIETIGASSASSVLKNTMESGCEMSLYVGHGNIHQLAEESLLSSSSIPALTNQTRTGIAGNMACLTASLTMPGVSSLGESLIVEAGGAAAMFGSASLVSRKESAELVTELVGHAYANNGSPRLGDAWVDAKNERINAGHRHVVSTYQLLGDPSISMGDAHASRGGPQVGPVRSSYEEWKTWAFAPAWLDAGLSSAPDANPDDDSLTNWEEYMAGTDPLDDHSELVVFTVRPLSENRMELSWASVPGRQYRVERASAADGSYTTLMEEIPADAPVNVWVDDSPSVATAIYRVSVK